MRDYSRAELLALTPAQYLANGYRDPDGETRSELLSDFATAASAQLMAAELSPQELSFTFEAVKALLPLHEDGGASGRIGAVVEEALEMVARMIQQPNNEGLSTWIRDCAAAVREPEDIDAFLAHLQAVLRQYIVFAASLPPSAPEQPSA